MDDENNQHGEAVELEHATLDHALEHDDGGDAHEPHEADDLEIVIDGEPVDAKPEPETNLVRDMRRKLREKERELAKLRTGNVAAEQEDAGARPKLEDSAYDEDAHADKLIAWNERKRVAESRKTEAQHEAERQRAEWDAELETHRARSKALGARDYQDAEDTVTDAMNPVQQAVLVKASKDSAAVIYALGRNPARLAELAKIADPIKLAVAIVNLEGKMSITRKSAPPAPERAVRGSAPASSGVDRVAQRLETDAERTGDYTAFFAHNRAKRAK